MTPHRNTTGGDQYLDADIQTASPARLRLMLIQRGIEVAAQVADNWRKLAASAGGDAPGPDEHSLKLLEILNELLSGVTGDQAEVCKTVADLYVFLAKHLIKAEETGDAGAIDEIRLVLQTEAETWRLVCANEVPRTPAMAATEHSTAGGLNLNI